MTPEIFLTIVLPIILGVISLFLGGKLRNLIKESKEFRVAVEDMIDYLTDAMEDHTLSNEERMVIARKFQTCLNEGKDVYIAVIEIIKYLKRR